MAKTLIDSSEGLFPPIKITALRETPVPACLYYRPDCHICQNKMTPITADKANLRKTAIGGKDSLIYTSGAAAPADNPPDADMPIIEGEIVEETTVHGSDAVHLPPNTDFTRKTRSNERVFRVLNQQGSVNWAETYR